MPIYTGVFIARFGFNTGMVILAATVFLSNFVFACGLSLSDYDGAGFAVVMVGRFILGVGSETLYIV